GVVIIITLLLLAAFAIITAIAARPTSLLEEKKNVQFAKGAASRSANDLESLKKLFDLRIKQYADDQKSLATSFTLQGLLIVLGLVMIYLPLQDVEVKGLGLKIPALMVQAFLPLALLYVWLGFGYLLHDLIENRMIL